ncbi:MAG: glycosyltransferase family 39 protein [Aquabacterium sp.]|nr:glycosyltransferase family 39 protein [Aquabacterium sp.]
MRNLRLGAISAAPQPAAWPQPWDWLLVVALAAVLRVAFFNGEFGSDDAVYVKRAQEVANGVWTSADYNGALRYGFNIPAGMFMALFGDSRFVANLWPLTCSLLEVALVYLFVRQNFGRSTALLAALLLGAAPLHVAVATRIHADPVVAMFLTASFVAVDAALARRSLFWCAVCGLCLGGVFWTKELVAVVFLAFVPFLWHYRRFGSGVVVILAGLGAMLILHGLLMWAVAGDPLHAVKVVTGQVGRSFIQGGGGEDSPLFYLRFLFLDIRHVGLLGLLALVPLVVLMPSRFDHSALPPLRFTLIWLAGLLLVLSVFPVSLSPLRFTMKQSNYISLFLAPMAVMAAIGLAHFRPRLRWWASALVLCLGLLLSALQQADYRSFTANSKAALLSTADRPGVLLVGSSNLQGMASVQNKLRTGLAPVVSFRDAIDDPDAYRRRLVPGTEVIAVIDRQTAAWFAGPRVIDSPQPCWQPLSVLAPTDLALGNTVAAGLASLVRLGPMSLAARVEPLLQRLAAPEPARMYRVPAGNLWCAAS